MATDAVLEEQLIEQSREAAGDPLDAAARRATFVVGGLFVVGATLVSVLYESERAFDPATALALMVVYAIASRVAFEIGGGYAIPTQIAFVPMVLVLPVDRVPWFVAGGLILGGLLDVWRSGLHTERLLSTIASSAYSLGPVTVVALAGEPAFGRDTLLVYGLALGAQLATDFGAATIHEWLRYDVRPSLQLRLMLEVYFVDLALTPLGVVIATQLVETWYPPLAVLPFMVLLQRFADERRRGLDHALELGHAYRGTAMLLGDVVEADDAYTGSHSREVVELVLAVSDRLGLQPAERQRAEFAALLHDVGKLRVPSEIVNKPGTLDPAELAIIRRHTIEGQRLLERVGGLLGEVGLIVRSCHERWDGKGYPDGLLADEIPLIARVVACCDAYHAMITDRSYRPALSAEESIRELRRNAGTQFDPVVVRALLDIVGAGSPEIHRRGPSAHHAGVWSGGETAGRELEPAERLKVG